MNAPCQLDLFSGDQSRVVLAVGSQPVCGVIFSRHMGSPIDKTGCRLPDGHEGPHLFVSDTGRSFHWENDWNCTCKDCQSEDSCDWCLLYWETEQHRSIAAPEIAA